MSLPGSFHGEGGGRRIRTREVEFCDSPGLLAVETEEGAESHGMQVASKAVKGSEQVPCQSPWKAMQPC